MEESTKPLSKKQKRIILLVVSVVLTVMAFIGFMVTYQVVKAEAHSRYIGIMNVTTEKVSRTIRGAEMNANNIFGEVSRNLDTPESVINALKSKANLNLDVRGYFAAFELDYFPEKGTWFEPYIYQPEYSSFSYRQVGSARHNYTKSPWYVRAKETGMSFWSDPYYYYDGTSMSGHYSTFVKPIYDSKGDMVCVCGADMKFEWLVKELERVDDISKSNKMMNRYHLFSDFSHYTIILNQDGTCLAQPGENPVDIKDEDVLKDIKHGKAGVKEVNINGFECMLYYGPVEFIDWTAAVVVPKTDLMQPIMWIGVLLLSLTLVGIISVWLVCRSKS